MSVLSFPVLVAPANPFCPAQERQAFLQGYLAEVSTPQIWHWNPSSSKRHSLGGLRQLALQEFQAFLQSLPKGFFVLTSGLEGLFCLEAMLLPRLAPGGMIWMNPHLELPFPAGLLRALRIAPWILPVWKWRHAHRVCEIVPKRRPWAFKKRTAAFSRKPLLRNNIKKYGYSEQLLWLRILAQSPHLKNLGQNSFPVLLLSGDLRKKQDRLLVEGLNRDLPHSEQVRFSQLGKSLLWEEPALCSFFVRKFIQENKKRERASPLPLLPRITLR